MARLCEHVHFTLTVAMFNSCLCSYSYVKMYFAYQALASYVATYKCVTFV